jgi:nucleoside-diphosphate-sugar epimerase
VGAPLVFLSTTSVYGTAKDVVDEACPVSDLKPQSPYAASKLRAEGFLSSLAQTSGLRHITCRFGTIFGTSIGMRFHTAINKFCWQAVMGQPLTVWRTALHQRRPYLELGDASRALVHVLERGLFDNQVYNVLTVNATVGEIVEAIRQFVPELRVELVDSAIMNQLSYHVSDTKFAAQGFRAKGDLTAGIRSTLRLLAAAAGRKAPIGVGS